MPGARRQRLQDLGSRRSCTLRSSLPPVNRVAYLDGIRALAIGAVLLVHWVASQFPVAYGGYIGVDIFFVLSGYIITTMLWKKAVSGTIGQQYGRFLKRRFVRLYPALLGFIIVTLALYAAFPGAPMMVGDLVGPALISLGQGYSVYAASGIAGSTPFHITWSLSVEWMFYILWPLAVYKLRRSDVDAVLLAKWAVAVAVVLYLLALPQDALWFYYGPVARVAEMLLGGALGLTMSVSARKNEEPTRPRRATTAAALCLAFIATYTVFGPAQWDSLFRYFGLPLTVAVTLYLIWFGIRSPLSPLTRLLGWGPLAFVGRVSYSLYLWHIVGIGLFTRDNLEGLPLPAIATIAVAFTVVMALLSYRFLELPFMKPQSDLLRSAPDKSTPSMTPMVVFTRDPSSTRSKQRRYP